MEEEEPKQKSEEKNDEETANTKDDTEGRPEGDEKPSDTEVSSAVKKEEMSETTEYDCSTDDSESLRLIFSSTDQSNCCSGHVK